jgi:predicted nuclease of predicted toxin-antitoxin system
MARLYADEDFPLPTVEELRRLGHDVLTVHDAGRAGQGISDAEVLADAIAEQRAVLTHNDVDFKHLHRKGQSHEGIISCTQDPADPIGLAQRVHGAIVQLAPLVHCMTKCFHRRVKVRTGRAKSRSLQELRECLAQARKSQYAEIWVDHGDFPSLCALINGDRGWLMYLRYDGDAGFSSRNSGYAGPKDATVDYFLSNGQRDEYPASWALLTTEVFEVLEWFAAHKASPSSIAWFNDSGDGNVSPNDDFVSPD